MHGLNIELTAAEWQRHHDELVSLLASQQGQTGARPWEPAFDRRIAELRSILARAVPAPVEDSASGTVTLGSRVTVRWQDGFEETYQIVPPDAVTSFDGMISYQSPVGQAIYGRRAGAQIAVDTPVGPEPIEIVAAFGPVATAPAIDRHVNVSA